MSDREHPDTAILARFRAQQRERARKAWVLASVTIALLVLVVVAAHSR